MVNANQLSKSIIYKNQNSILKQDDINNNNCKRLRIIHFNDVYNIEGDNKESKAGAARFATLIKALKAQEPGLVLFSGDAFAPSTLSTITKGEHMIPVLNSLGIEVACIGNHDFDFGVEHLVNLIGQTNFPWLISNVFDVKSKRPLAHLNVKHIAQINGLKIGIVGLVEKEWIETLNFATSEDVHFESYVDIGKKLANELKNDHNCDYVIALTHMRVPNDRKLAELVPEIDIILGGHDHHYFTEFIGNKWVIKSGSDFNDLSVIEIDIDSSNKKSSINKIERFHVDFKIKEDEDIKTVVNEYNKIIKIELEAVLGHVDFDLEGRFDHVRVQESNLGNFVCDLMKEAVHADCAILNSGTLRIDSVFKSGPLTLGDLKKIIPNPFTVILIECDGLTLYKALENSVSQYPSLEGRFAQTSGLRFSFRPSNPKGGRIDLNSIRVNGQALDVNKKYKVATKSYLKRGRDGYTMLVDCPVIIDEETGPFIETEIKNYFQTHKKLLDKHNVYDRIICIKD